MWLSNPQQTRLIKGGLLPMNSSLQQLIVIKRRGVSKKIVEPLNLREISIAQKQTTTLQHQFAPMIIARKLVYFFFFCNKKK